MVSNLEVTSIFDGFLLTSSYLLLLQMSQYNSRHFGRLWWCTLLDKSLQDQIFLFSPNMSQHVVVQLQKTVIQLHTHVAHLLACTVRTPQWRSTAMNIKIIFIVSLCKKLSKSTSRCCTSEVNMLTATSRIKFLNYLCSCLIPLLQPCGSMYC